MNFDTVGRLGEKLDVFHSRYLPVWAHVYLWVKTLYFWIIKENLNYFEIIMNKPISKNAK